MSTLQKVLNPLELN